MRSMMMAAAPVLLSMAGAAQAQETNIWSHSFARSESITVCVERAKNVAFALGMKHGSDATGAWMAREGSPITTVVRCDLPQLILVITAAPKGYDNRAVNAEIVAGFRTLAGK